MVVVYATSLLSQKSQRKVLKQLTTLNFMKYIVGKLNEDNLMTRLHSIHLPRQIRSIISPIVKCDIPEDFGQSDVQNKLPRNERKYCYLCHYKKRTKTAYICCTCQKPVCLSCSMKICRHCVTEKWLNITEKWINTHFKIFFIWRPFSFVM